MNSRLRLMLFWGVLALVSRVGAQDGYVPYSDPVGSSFMEYNNEAEMDVLGGGKSDCDCGKTDCGCRPLSQHSSAIFGEFMYLRFMDSEVTFATPANGPVVAPPAVQIQTGRLGVADLDAQPGFRFGVDFCLDECSSIRVAYSFFDGQTNAFVQTAPGQVIAPMLLHPSSPNAGTNALASTASYGIAFEQGDIMYRAVFNGGHDWVVNWGLGFRYMHLDQKLNVLYTLAGTNETVSNRIRFDGGGVAFALDSMRRSRSGWLIYSKGSLAFMGGDFRAAYHQASNFDPNIVDARWKAGRIVTTTDIELGFGWESHCGSVRTTLGVTLGGWHNIVSTDEYVQAVRSNNFVGLEDTISYLGGVGRIEYHW